MPKQNNLIYEWEMKWMHIFHVSYLIPMFYAAI